MSSFLKGLFGPKLLRINQTMNYEPVSAEKWGERVIRSPCRIGEKRRKLDDLLDEIKNLTVAIKGSLGNNNGDENMDDE